MHEANGSKKKEGSKEQWKREAKKRTLISRTQALKRAGRPHLDCYFFARLSLSGMMMKARLTALQASAAASTANAKIIHLLVQL